MVQIPSVSSFSAANPVSIKGAGSATAPQSGGVSFEQLMSRLLTEADQPQQSVSSDMNKILQGDVDNIHDVAINVAKADIAFRMVMEVRDKLINAYQDVMRMQV